jgi:cyanophycinase-like exopeptidase
MADGFVMSEGESAEDMYRRLTALAVQLGELSANFADDHWVKRKFYNALLPYEEGRLTAIHQNARYRSMTSNEVLSEIIALDISKKNADELVA